MYLLEFNLRGWDGKYIFRHRGKCAKKLPASAAPLSILTFLSSKSHNGHQPVNISHFLYTTRDMIILWSEEKSFFSMTG
jgi:hypothetical protein